MLSGHSFNALLKTLEEPPPHVKFLLATTDPQAELAVELGQTLVENPPPSLRDGGVIAAGVDEELDEAFGILIEQ